MIEGAVCWRTRRTVGDAAARARSWRRSELESYSSCAEAVSLGARLISSILGVCLSSRTGASFGLEVDVMAGVGSQ